MGATYLVDAAGHQIDVHVISVQADGAAMYWMEDGDSWTYPSGVLDGRGEVVGQLVRCVSAEMMMLEHTTGYALDAVHQGDVEALEVAFGIPSRRTRPRDPDRADGCLSAVAGQWRLTDPP